MPTNKNEEGGRKQRKPCWRGFRGTGKPGKKKVIASQNSCHATLRSRRNICYGSPQRRKSHPMFLVVYQRPLSRTGVAEPVVFDVPWLLFCADKRWDRTFARFGETLGVYQEEFAFPQSQKRLVTLSIGAMTKHGIIAFCSSQSLEERSN